MVMVMERMRPYLLEPGDSLLVTDDIEETVLRYGKVSQLTGIPGEQIVLSFMSSLPMPRYKQRQPGQLRWPGTNAAQLWAPTYWIPEEIAQRMPVADADAEGGLRGESDDEWSARIALHMVMAGLYIPESGQFVDVPAALGVDLEDEDVLQRVQAWLDGSADAELDALDPSPLWRPQDADVDAVGVYYSLRDTYSDLFALSRYIGFDSVLRTFDELNTRSSEITDETAKEAAAYAVSLAKLVAVGVGDEDLDAIVTDAEANVVVAQSHEELSGFALPELIAALVEVRDRYQAQANKASAAGNVAVDTAATASHQGERPSARQAAAERTQE